MTGLMTLTVAAALIGLVGVRGLEAIRSQHWRRFAVELVGVAGVAILLHGLFGFPTPLPNATAKDTKADWPVVVVLFVSMGLGMVAHFLYEHFSIPRRLRVRRRLDWGLLLAPICASPIVFIPLMVAMQEANIDLRQLTVPRVMLLLVAFQNGFFWKEHFDRQRMSTEKAPI